MKRLMIVLCVAAVVGLASTAAQADITWNFTNAGDYWVNNAVVTALPVGGSAYVAPRIVNPSDPNDVAWGADYAAVFARIDTQAHHLKVGDIAGGGFTLSGMNHPDAVYGSLYLSPTGLGGSTVMINMSPMGRTGSDGSYIYTFDLDTLCDVKIGAPDWGTAQYAGTFGDAIDWINASPYSLYTNTYAAFFGPQIGMSGTSETTFTVSQIKLVPEPGTLTLLGLAGLTGLATVWIRRRRSNG